MIQAFLMHSFSLVILFGLANVPAAFAQTAPRPTFEVAAIKPCKADEVASGIEARSSGNGKAASSESSVNRSPGLLVLNCLPLRSLMRMAYIDFPGGRRNIVDFRASVGGGPSWVDSDRYAIVAKAEGNVSQAMMRGAMLHVLLEDRFKLKVPHEAREVPVYDLTVAKNGLKMPRTAAGSCVRRDEDQVPLPPKAPNGKPWCSTITLSPVGAR